MFSLLSRVLFCVVVALISSGDAAPTDSVDSVGGQETAFKFGIIVRRADTAHTLGIMELEPDVLKEMAVRDLKKLVHDALGEGPWWQLRLSLPMGSPSSLYDVAADTAPLTTFYHKDNHFKHDRTWYLSRGDPILEVMREFVTTGDRSAIARLRELVASILGAEEDGDEQTQFVEHCRDVVRSVSNASQPQDASGSLSGVSESEQRLAELRKETAVLLREMAGEMNVGARPEEAERQVSEDLLTARTEPPAEGSDGSVRAVRRAEL